MLILLGGKIQIMKKEVLKVLKNWISTTEYKHNHTSHRFNYITKDEQDIKYLCSYIENDIKYFMKQCFTHERLQINHVF